MNWNHLIKAGVGIAALTACFAAQAGSNGVTVTLSPEKNTLGKSDDVVVRVTITNTSSSPQYVLKWHTPFAGVEEHLFDITRDGVDVPYAGRHYKRQAPTAKDYYLLKPGASHSARVELSAMYDMSVTGDYAVKYHTASLSLFAPTDTRGSLLSAGARGVTEPGSEIGEIASAPVSLWIDGRLERGTVVANPFDAARQEAAAVAAASVSFTNCSASQSNTITSAIAAAKTMANSGVTYLNNGSTGQRYTKWFGAYNASRYATV